MKRTLEKLQLTHAEDFPQKIKITLRDVFAILFVPLIFLNGYFFQHILQFSPLHTALADSLFRGLLFVLICVIYGKILSLHWKKFNLAKGPSWALVIVGAIVLQVVIMFTRELLPLFETTSTGAKEVEGLSADLMWKPSLIVFIITLGPVFTSLIEDIVFRYTLLSRLFVPGKIWRISLVLLNSIVFGLIHYNNFGGNILATTTFMSAGLFLNIIYLWTRNIWHVLLIHALNNFVLSVLGLLLLWVVKSITG